MRKSSTLLTNYVSNERAAFLTLFNVQTTNAGTYRIVITNAANPAPGLTLDPGDLDHSRGQRHGGLPDEWEIAHGLAPNNAADAAFDPDHDGQSNAQEYLAGTDPQDSASFLRVDRLLPRRRCVSRRCGSVQRRQQPHLHDSNTRVPRRLRTVGESR